MDSGVRDNSTSHAQGVSLRERDVPWEGAGKLRGSRSATIINLLKIDWEETVKNFITKGKKNITKKRTGEKGAEGKNTADLQRLLKICHIPKKVTRRRSGRG